MMSEPPLRVLVTGATGQLGYALGRFPWPDGIDCTALPRDALDITNSQRIAQVLATHSYDVVVNTAADTAVDEIEGQQDRAFELNAEGPRRLAIACRKSGIVLLHISTDYVFDGEKVEPYRETDPVAPLSGYGESKAAGEAFIREILCRHLIVRTAWLYSARRRNFVRTILRAAQDGKELRVVADQTGSPTSAPELARAIAAILIRIARDQSAGRDTPWGTYHCANRGEASWYDVAKACMSAAEPWLSHRPAIVPIRGHEYASRVARPKNSRLNCDKLARDFSIELARWNDAIVPVVREICKQEARNATAGDP